MSQANTTKEITLTVNGTAHELTVEPRKLLVHAIREDLDLTGTHIGCDTGNCGACTVLVDGEALKSCMLFAVQAEGSEVLTVEGMEDHPEAGEGLHPIQEGFREEHGLQCGFCTPGMIVTGKALLDENPDPTDEEVRQGISGTLCRCTGYQNIVDSIQYAADELSAEAEGETEAEAAAADGGTATDGGTVQDGDRVGSGDGNDGDRTASADGGGEAGAGGGGDYR